MAERRWEHLTIGGLWHPMEEPHPGSPLANMGLVEGAVYDDGFGNRYRWWAVRPAVPPVCSCLTVEAEHEERTIDPNTGLPWIQVRDERYRQQTMREIAIEQEMRRG
jgi:hypothetical protein